MKTKKIVGALCIALILTTVSCKKTYECHCDKKGGGSDHVDVKAKKKDADAECKKIQEGNSNYSKCEVE